MEELSMIEMLKERIADLLNIDPSEITADTDLKEDLGADSLDLFELAVSLQDEYDIEIPIEKLVDMHTVGDVVAYLTENGITV